jgi:hypothetical protein
MNARISTELNFIAGVYYNGAVQMNSYIVKLWMIVTSDEHDSHTIAFDRIRYFIHEVLDSTIFINNKDAKVAEKFIKAGFKVATFNDDPLDQVVGIMLYYKLNAIMEGRMTIMETELSSAFSDGITYLHSEIENAEINKPDWWSSPGFDHGDIHLTNKDKVVSMQNAKSWRDVDLAWDSDETNAFGNTIVFADFSKNDDTK